MQGLRLNDLSDPVERRDNRPDHATKPVPLGRPPFWHRHRLQGNAHRLPDGVSDSFAWAVVGSAREEAAMVAFVWLGIAAVVLGVGVLLASTDRRSRRKGHVLRGSSRISTSVRDQNADARVIDGTYGMVIPPKTPRPK